MAVRLSSGSRRAKTHPEIRPTAARTLESVFDILQTEVQRRFVLDLFSGVGSYGIMALRRGSLTAVFVDSSREAERRVTKAIAHYHLETQATVFREEVAHFLHRAEREQQEYDLVFVDPPYESVSPGPVIQAILDARIMTRSSILVFEHSKHHAPPEFAELTLRKSRVFGETTVSIWDHP
jgi:16S rRNA (guanine(966)-N(2))-methyltransferase RsmD